jgi:hypothetical protein
MTDFQHSINASPANAERLGDLSGPEALRFQPVHLCGVY